MNTVFVIAIVIIALGLIVHYWKQALGIAVIGVISFYSYKLFGLYGVGGFIGLILLCILFNTIGWMNVFKIALSAGVLGALFVIKGWIAFGIGLAIILILYVIIEMISNSNQNKAYAAIIKAFASKGMADLKEIERSVKSYDKLIMKKSLNILAAEVLNKLVSEGKAEVITMSQGEKKGTQVYKMKDITQGMNFVRREISLD